MSRRRERRPVRAAARALVALQALCVLGPVAIIVVWAFTASWPWPSLLPETFSARGIEELFGPAQRAGEVLGASVGIALATAALTTAVATLAGRALSHYRFFGREALRFAVLLPFLIPATVFAMGVQVALIRAGLAGTVAGVVLAHSIVALPYGPLSWPTPWRRPAPGSRSRRGCAVPAARERGSRSFCRCSRPRFCRRPP